MKQKYKITSIITAFICLVIVFYTIPTARHWFYYKLTDLIVNETIPNKEIKNINLADYLVLDCREEEEYNISHIPNSIWIGNNNDRLFWSRLPNDNIKPVLIYCSIGYRSAIIGQKIADSLHYEIYNLKYGIFNYNHHKNPLRDSLGKPTKEVHPYSKFWGLFVY